MKKKALILALGAALTMFGCGDDDNGGAGTGGTGGTAGTGGTGGGFSGPSTTSQLTCNINVDPIGDLAIDVDITLQVTPGTGEVTVGYEITAFNALLGGVASLATVEDLAIGTSIVGGTPDSLTNGLADGVAGTSIAAFLVDGVIVLETPDSIDSVTQAITGSPVTMNWDGTFSLTLEAATLPVVVDQSACDVDVMGEDLEITL